MRLRLASAPPYVAAFLVLLSMLFPNRDLREVRALRAEFEQVKADNDRIREDFASTLAFLRSDDFAGAVSSLADGGAGLSSAPVGEVVDAPNCAYMRVGNLDGLRCGSDWWLVGDSTPWGVLESSFRGGFVADGSRYRCTKGVLNDL